MSGEIPSPSGPARETILVLEDDDATRSGIRRMLEGAGYTVLTAATAVEAIELAADHEVRIHLLVTDFELRSVTGRQVADVLLRGRPGLRVLYVSGRAEAEVAPQGRLAPGTAFLQKPFSMKDLLRQVRELLDQGRTAG